jgi:hypothetical protein
MDRRGNPPTYPDSAAIGRTSKVPGNGQPEANRNGRFAVCHLDHGIAANRLLGVNVRTVGDQHLAMGRCR